MTSPSRTSIQANLIAPKVLPVIEPGPQQYNKAKHRNCRIGDMLGVPR
ncbi:MAG: hypothetical protein JO235_05740 [Chroococcidiopsidaceae cyanobacterium CP_BM_RX_35]|nr:hypothetical protein [Chroococcidiopsidaceae cyanobacterium CP_BM_RX_35]